MVLYPRPPPPLFNVGHTLHGFPESHNATLKRGVKGVEGKIKPYVFYGLGGSSSTDMLYRSQLTCCVDFTDAASIVIPITTNLISPYGSNGASSLKRALSHANKRRHAKQGRHRQVNTQLLTHTHTLTQAHAQTMPTDILYKSHLRTVAFNADRYELDGRPLSCQ